MPDITYGGETHWIDERDIASRAAQLRSYPRPTQDQRSELAALERHERKSSKLWALAQKQYGAAIPGTDPDSGYDRQAAIDQGRSQAPEGADRFHPRTIQKNPSALIRSVRMQLEEDVRRDILPARSAAVLEAGIMRTEPQAGLGLAEYLAATGDRFYYEAFGQMLLNPQRAQVILSDRHRNAMARALSARALEVGTPASWGSGSYPVPYQLDPTVILNSAGVTGSIRNICRTEQIVGREWLGVTSTGVTVTRAPELTAASDGAPTLTQPSVAASRVQCFVPFSVEVEQDWNGLLAELATLIADAKDVEENSSFLTGPGTGNYPQGILTGLGTANTYTSAGTGAVAASDVFATEELIAPRFRVNRQWIGSIPFAEFGRSTQRGNLVNTPLLADLPGDRGEGIMGRPFMEYSGLGSIASTNYVAIVGDWKQYLVIDRVGMSLELIPHVFSSGGLPQGERGIWAMWRNSAIVLSPNAFGALKVR